MQNDVLEFITRRLDILLHEQGWAHDVIAAVLAQQAANAGAFLGAFERLVPAIQAFFKEVMVNTDAPVLQTKRLGLLQAIAGLAPGHADLSTLTGL